MSSEPTPPLKFDLGHVLLIDIVAYSKLSIDDQSKVLRQLNEIVRGTEQFRRAEAEGVLMRLPTGDGMALIFRDSPEAPAQCALEIDLAARDYPELRLRMGIHSGPVSEVADVNQRANLAGAGIDLAQRVMDCGDAGHILLSRRVADDLEPYAKWRPYLHDLGEHEVKHGVRIRIVNLYTHEAGSSLLPEKLSAPARKPSAASRWNLKELSRKWISWRVIGGALVVAGTSAAIFLRSPERQSGASAGVTAYPNKSYEGKRWSKIYSADRLLPAKALFLQMTGWNRQNLAITGTIGTSKLLVSFRNGKWTANQLSKTSRTDKIFVCTFVNEKELALLTGIEHGHVGLGIWVSDSYRELGTVPAGTSLHALGGDVFCGMNGRGVYWRYSDNAVQQFEADAREGLIFRDENEVARVSENGPGSADPMTAANIRDVTAFSGGEAVGLWSDQAGDCATVRYKDGRWFLVDRIARFSARNFPDKAWFVDAKNFVAIGSDKVTRSADGKVTLQAVVVEGEEYPAKELGAVWGHDLNTYWTADRRGNVFGFESGQWKLVARGPILEAGKKLEALSPAPDGSIIALDSEAIYALE